MFERDGGIGSQRWRAETNKQYTRGSDAPRLNQEELNTSVHTLGWCSRDIPAFIQSVTD